MQSSEQQKIPARIRVACVIKWLGSGPFSRPYRGPIPDSFLNTDMQRRVNIALNKGEAHHALKHALRIGRQDEILHRTSE